ncbi:MAG: type IV pilus secretin PilQ family protein [Cocleimonas sp.]|nr:type IV pilus secretin PilQ family protein [Cocleimonas sp.]
MKTFKYAMFALTLPVVLLATENCQATNSLQAINTLQQASGNTLIKLQFDGIVTAPKNFILKSSKILVLDFPDTVSAFKLRNEIIQSNLVKQVKFARASGKLRVMVMLKKVGRYRTKVVGNEVQITFFKIRQSVAARPDPNRSSLPIVHRQSVSHQSMANNYTTRPQGQAPIRPYMYEPAKNAKKVVHHRAPSNFLGLIDFRRESNGNGRIIIPLPHSKVVVKAVKKGNKVSLVLEKVRLKQASRRLNVLDFATPAAYLDITRHGTNAQIDITARTAFTYEARHEGGNYIVLMKRIKLKAKRKAKVKNPLKTKKKVYKGKKLSLNFQDIEIRSVLQLLADFTDKNIVVSDSVKGNITLRLKSVPWDQALDIVLESKALGMRSNGNVIWVALAKELAEKEKRELKSLKIIQELEPLVTEYIAVNFAKAEDLIELVKASKGDNEGTLLSKKGSISVDGRTNTLLVQDSISHIDAIREMVKSLDIPIRQVAIEARIVIANDEFGKNIGARFGATQLAPFGSRGLMSTSGSSNALNSVVNDASSGSSSGGLSPVKIPNLSDRLNVNMPIAGAAGKFGFSILAKSFLLDLELSALQAENKGEVISTPRVVTANKKQAHVLQGVGIPFLSTTKDGGTKVAFKNAALRLEVTPQITPDNHVIMDLKINQDTVGKIFAGVPSINRREINTQVLVESGQTVVLGGVHEEEHKNDVEKVPFLGDLPYIGKLFQRTYKKEDKRELLIFVTPKVLD